MNLSNREKLLYEAIRELGGGALSEDVLRRKTGLGHATLWAARRDLIDKGLLVVTRENRRSVFSCPLPKMNGRYITLFQTITIRLQPRRLRHRAPPRHRPLFRHRSARRRLRLGSPRRLPTLSRISRASLATSATWMTGRTRSSRSSAMLT